MFADPIAKRNGALNKGEPPTPIPHTPNTI